MVVIFLFSPWVFYVFYVNSIVIHYFKFCNLLIWLIIFSTTLNILASLMLPNVEFVFVFFPKPPKPNSYKSHLNWQCTCYANICMPSLNPKCDAMEYLFF